MIARTVLFLSIAALLVLALPASIDDESNQSGPSVHMEPQCARQGGQCMMVDECPKPPETLKMGLCPMQQAAGVECCNGVSTKEHRCAKRGGQCLPRTRCGRQLWDEKADDCGKDETCCILV